MEKQEAQERERTQRIEILTQVAEDMRKTVSRMRQAGEVASLARGEYTTPGHPYITKSIHDNSDVPTETMETRETRETRETSVTK